MLEGEDAGGGGCWRRKMKEEEEDAGGGGCRRRKMLELEDAELSRISPSPIPLAHGLPAFPAARPGLQLTQIRPGALTPLPTPLPALLAPSWSRWALPDELC